jgi:hypothetical protein
MCGVKIARVRSVSSGELHNDYGPNIRTDRKALSMADRLRLATLILNDIPPQQRQKKDSFQLPFSRNGQHGTYLMVKAEVKRAPSDREGNEPTIRRSPDAMHRYYRQPSRLYSAPIDQAQAFPLSSVRQEGQTPASDPPTHSSHSDAASPSRDCRGSWRV